MRSATKIGVRAASVWAVLVSAGVTGASMAAAQAAGATLLLHGNYCGPSNNAPLESIDALDAACARHDACSPRGALPSRACNARLQRDASAIWRDPRQAEDVRALAGLVSAGAGILPSEPRVPGRGLVLPTANAEHHATRSAPPLSAPSPSLPDGAVDSDGSGEEQ